MAMPADRGTSRRATPRQMALERRVERSLLVAGVSSALASAYLATTYRVESARSAIALRVGQHNAALDRLLKQRGVHAWAFVTACNPRSQRLPSWRNGARQRSLIMLSRRLGYATLMGTGVGDDPTW